jgi:hypothetical protein
MAFRFADGQTFTTSAASYHYRPATPRETTPRVILDVEIEGIPTQAMVDTGGIYLLCHPQFAAQLDLDISDATSGLLSMLFRGVFVQGRLYRLNVSLPADEGEDVPFQATAFVPEHYEEEQWGAIPSILGFHGCLERIRMAIDPVTDTFYFGPTG